jgi:hypothetical protein
MGQRQPGAQGALKTLVAMAVLHDERHIRLFVWVDAASTGFYGFKGGI